MAGKNGWGGTIKDQNSRDFAFSVTITTLLACMTLATALLGLHPIVVLAFIVLTILGLCISALSI
jgi:hypothetical protein